MLFARMERITRFLPIANTAHWPSSECVIRAVKPMDHFFLLYDKKKEIPAGRL